MKKWDVFISHATEDKEAIAKPLAEALQEKGIKVWYDKISLTLGDSLRRSIDEGLSESDYGIVILSKNFFAKDWPQRELDGLVAKEIGGKKVILPIWHDIDQDVVVRYSPILADKVAVSTSQGLDVVVQEIIRVINPESYRKSKKKPDNSKGLKKTTEKEKTRAPFYKRIWDWFCGHMGKIFKFLVGLATIAACVWGAIAIIPIVISLFRLSETPIIAETPFAPTNTFFPSNTPLSTYTHIPIPTLTYTPSPTFTYSPTATPGNTFNLGESIPWDWPQSQWPLAYKPPRPQWEYTSVVRFQSSNPGILAIGSPRGDLALLRLNVIDRANMYHA